MNNKKINMITDEVLNELRELYILKGRVAATTDLLAKKVSDREIAREEEILVMLGYPTGEETNAVSE